MKKIQLVVAALGLAIGLSFAAGPSSAEVKLRIAHCCAPTHNIGITATKLAELAKAKSKGNLDVAVFPQGQLGSERELVEGVRLGVVDMAVVSTGPTPGFVKETGVLNLPYLFQSYEHADKVLDGKVGQQLLDAFTPIGIKALAFSEVGFRHLTTKRTPVAAPSDLKGLKIRTMENNVHMESFRVFGASPVPMAFGELYLAMQQGTVDGQENPLSSVWTAKYYEVQEYLILTGHFYQPTFILMNMAKFRGLSPPDQAALQSAAREAGIYARQVGRKDEAEILQKIRGTRMKVLEVDKSAFIKAAKTVYDRLKIDDRLVTAIKGEVP